MKAGMTGTKSDLHPESGARVLLERVSDDGESAHYRVTLFFSDSKIEGKARVRRGGTSEVELESEPPEWAAKITQAFLRQASVQRSPGGTPRWPRRLMRWRPQKP